MPYDTPPSDKNTELVEFLSSKSPAHVAAEVSYALLVLYRENEADKIKTTLKHGIGLLDCLNQLILHISLDGFGEYYHELRKFFFVERVSPWQLGYEAWDAAVNQEAKKELPPLYKWAEERRLSELLNLLIERPDSVSNKQLEDLRIDFAHLSSILSRYPI